MRVAYFIPFTLLLMVAFFFQCSEDEGAEKENEEKDNLEAPAGTDLVIDLAGTYTVTNESVGSHTRKTVIIGTDGAIDFDTNTSFSVSDINAVYDRLSCCNRVAVNYGADDDAEVINLFVDANGSLESVQFRHRNDNIDIQVDVE